MKENNIYKDARKNLKLSRAAVASQSFLAEKKIERIEAGKTPEPDEVLELARIYNNYDLCNHYCSKECAIGTEFMPHSPLSERSLAEISMAILSELNSINRKRNMMIDVSADCAINENEYDNFKQIYNNLESIEMNIQSLKLWVKENMKDTSFLDE
ncbi:MAG: helix-turn-helix domain-containing protein [Lachnospiraceae bacterium]|nr:helix-turn-helix domain-containing protein [Lachnospiraceae bacterium]